MKWLLLLCLSFNCYAAEKDKILHFGASFFIASTAHAVTDDYYKAGGVCLAAGVGKELYDEYKYGGFDVKDLAFDVAGCATGILFSEYIIKPKVTRNYAGIELNIKL